MLIFFFYWEVWKGRQVYRITQRRSAGERSGQTFALEGAKLWGSNLDLLQVCKTRSGVHFTVWEWENSLGSKLWDMEACWTPGVFQLAETPALLSLRLDSVVLKAFSSLNSWMKLGQTKHVLFIHWSWCRVNMQRSGAVTPGLCYSQAPQDSGACREAFQLCWHLLSNSAF